MASSWRSRGLCPGVKCEETRWAHTCSSYPVFGTPSHCGALSMYNSEFTMECHCHSKEKRGREDWLRVDHLLRGTDHVMQQFTAMPLPFYIANIKTILKVHRGTPYSKGDCASAADLLDMIRCFQASPCLTFDQVQTWLRCRPLCQSPKCRCCRLQKNKV